MNNTLHTGGDWYVQRIHTMKDKTPHDHDIWAVYSTQRTRYLDKPQDICFFNWRTPAGKANAYLISAAPDLLSAAWNAANVLAALATGQLAAIHPDSNALQELRAAIAKAKGEA